MAALSNAQEKSSNNGAATAGSNDTPAKPASPPDIRTPSGDRVYRVGGGVTPPRTIKAPQPKYPKSAKKEGIEGTVVLWLIVNAQGLPEQIKIERALGHGFDQSAVETVSNWKFAPATKGGIPVPVMVNVEVNFRLH